MQKMQICPYLGNRWRYRKTYKIFRGSRGSGTLRYLTIGKNKKGLRVEVHNANLPVYWKPLEISNNGQNFQGF